MKKVVVTDHAVIRWLERQYGMDINAARAELAELARPYLEIGAKHAPIGNVWAVLENGCVITVTPNKPPPSMVHRHDFDTVNGTSVEASEEARRNWEFKNRRKKRR